MVNRIKVIKDKKYLNNKSTLNHKYLTTETVMKHIYYYRSTNTQPKLGLLANWCLTAIHSDLLEINRVQEDRV